MKILHTSDWHLAHRLYDQSRLPEHKVFMDWLRQLIAAEQVNVLIVAGDIFDNTNPRLDAQEIYTDFLDGLFDDRIAGTSVCRHIVVVAGNHDSAAFLEVHRSILRRLNVHIVGNVGNEPDEWKKVVLELKHEGKTEAIVAALPFVSEVDIRKPVTIASQELSESPPPSEAEISAQIPTETSEAKVEKTSIKHTVLHAYKTLWQTLADLCVECRQQSEHSPYIPLISTGHLFTDGGKTLSDDGLRKIYVGTLERFPGGEIPKQFDYVALGHLHVPQQVGQSEHHRYSGSPLPINFDEAARKKQDDLVEGGAYLEKQVVLVEWDQQGVRTIKSIPIPTIRKLVQIKGDWETIQTEITNLLRSLDDPSDKPHLLDNESVWLEVQYTDTSPHPDLVRSVGELLNDRKDVHLSRCFSQNKVNAVGLTAQSKGESLKKLDPIEVFMRVLNDNSIVEEEKRNEYIQTYQEALAIVDNEDQEFGAEHKNRS